MALWSKSESPLLSCDSLGFSKKFATEKSVQDFRAWLCTQEFLDAAYWLSSAYSLWADAGYRKDLAMFFTPPLLTFRLLKDLEQAGVSFGTDSFMDPACGGGAFLAPIAIRMRATLKAKGKSSRQVLKHIETHLFGTDLDPVLCGMSQHFLRMALATEIIESSYEPQFLIACADSLKDISALERTIDVVVCNPPFRKMTSSEVAKYRVQYSAVISNQPNIYGLFMTLCLRLLKIDGVAALVTPTSYMCGQYFSALRQHLMTNSEILQICIVSDRSDVFIHVQQETALTLFRRRECLISTGITTQANLVSRNGESKAIGRCALPNAGAAWPIPRADGDAELIRMMGQSKFRLSDYGYTPRIGMFVWNRDQRRTFFSLREAKKSKVAGVVPLLWSSDIQLNGKVRFSEEVKENREPSFVDLTCISDRTVVRGTSVLLQRVTSNDQARRLVAALVPAEMLKRYGGFIGENHTVILEAKEKIPVVSPKILVHLLRSNAVDRYFRCISGAINVSIFELSQLPLPDPQILLKEIVRHGTVDLAVNAALSRLDRS